MQGLGGAAAFGFADLEGIDQRQPQKVTVELARLLGVAATVGVVVQSFEHGGLRFGLPALTYAYQWLRSSRSFKNTVLASGCSGKSGNASRKRAMTAGLCNRKKLFTSRSRARVLTKG